MTERAAIGLLLGTLLAPGLARAACDPLDEGEFRTLVLNAQSAIDRGDIELPARILEDVHFRLACLTFAPPPRMWADLMVAQAIVEFSREGDWEAPLSAALRIRPAIDRGVASGHPIASWKPLPPPAPGGPVPRGTTLYVDGLVSETMPPAQGLYLAQRTDGRFWNTRLVHDEALPANWAAQKVEQPRRIKGWVSAGGLFGVANVAQNPEWERPDYYVDTLITSVALGATVDLAVAFYSPFGILVSGSGAIAETSPGLDGRVAAIWTWRGLTAGIGAGTTGFDTYARDDEHRVLMLRYALSTAHLRFGRKPRWDAGLTLGRGAAMTRSALRLGVALPDTVRNRWRLGLDATGSAASLEQVGAPRFKVSTWNTRVMLQLGLVWGEY